MANWQIITWRIQPVQICTAGSAGQLRPAPLMRKRLNRHRVVEALVESMSFRHIGVVAEEYAVSKDGIRMFGVLDLEAGFEGCRFAIGLRNSHDKSFRLSRTVGVRVFVCENFAFIGDYTAVLAKHSKNWSLEDSLAIGVDRMQRNFEPMRRQVEKWRASQISPVAAELIIYQPEEFRYILSRCPPLSLRQRLPLQPPKCSSCSTGLPDPPPPSAGPDWGQARSVASPPLPSPAQVSAPAFRSASPPAPPLLLWNPAAPGRGPSSVSSSVRPSFENCYSFSRVDLLISNCTL
jgi:hypothetical protein